MPLGFWKSKWEIHREDMDRYRAEAQRRDQEYREEARRYREECRDLQVRGEQELRAIRRSTQEILARMETPRERIERLKAWTRRQPG